VKASLSNPFNGYFVITSLPSTSSFNYVMGSDPGADGDVGTTPTFQGKWQVRRQVIENNLIELGANISPTGYGPPTGVYMVGANSAPVYTFIQTVIRNNVIRQVDDAADTTPFPTGITFYACDSVIVEGNTINMYYPIIFDNRSRTVDCFNNATPSGVLIRGFNASTQRYSEELATNIEDALCISI
jgi:hypothetical protein